MKPGPSKNWNPFQFIEQKGEETSHEVERTIENRAGSPGEIRTRYHGYSIYSSSDPHCRNGLKGCRSSCSRKGLKDTEKTDSRGMKDGKKKKGRKCECKKGRTEHSEEKTELR